MANVGGIDRVLRFIVGIVLILVPFVAPSLAPSVPALGGLGNWGWVIGAIGLVMLLTAVFRFCPAYVLFGVRTCAMR